MDKPISESRRAFEKWCRENGYTNGSRLSQVWGEFDTEDWELWKAACEYMETANGYKLFRWLGAWLFFGMGDLLSRLPHYPYRPYNWLMTKSVECQGMYGFKRWPWRESDLWEKVDG